MERVFLSLGSNQGNRLSYLHSALKKIADLAETRLVRVSSIYETDPVGVREQPMFLNLTAEIATALPSEALFQRFKDIEVEVGRTKSIRWGPREIDIDIIYFGSHVLKTERLEIPHPERGQRRFVLQPLAEIAKEFNDPIMQCTVEDLLERCPDPNHVRKTDLEISINQQEM